MRVEDATFILADFRSSLCSDIDYLETGLGSFGHIARSVVAYMLLSMRCMCRRHTHTYQYLHIQRRPIKHTVYWEVSERVRAPCLSFTPTPYLTPKRKSTSNLPQCNSQYIPILAKNLLHAFTCICILNPHFTSPSQYCLATSPHPFNRTDSPRESGLRECRRRPGKVRGP
jgi:hypothetical protein